jgi:hypothetical protein
MNIGDSAVIERRFSAEDLRGLGAIIGVDLSASDGLPEPLIGALFSYLLGVKLPGPGTNYLKQEITFLRAAPIDRAVIARVTVSRLRPEKHLCDLETIAQTPDGALIARGRALVSIRDVETKAG